MTYFNPKIVGNIEPHTNAVINDAVLLINAGAVSTDDLQFNISEYKNSRDNIPKGITLTWDLFCAHFSEHKIQATKDGVAWSPATYNVGATRKNENVQSVSMAVVDVDDGTPIEALVTRLTGYAFLLHTSYSHSVDTPKYRVVIPFSHPVAPADWLAVWTRINLLVGDCNDPATKDPARLYYKPAHAPDAVNHFVKIQTGRPIVVSDLPELAMPIAVHSLKFHRSMPYQQLVEIDGIESGEPELNFEQGLKEVVNRCPFMQFASDPENQDNVSEPLWMAMISNACRFQNSEPWIHAASEHHSEYDEGETDNRINRYRSGFAPVTCNRILELGFKGCPSGGCKKPNGEITKSPAGLHGWMFKKQLTAEQTVTGQMPEEYDVESFHVKPSGVYQTIVTDEKSRIIRISSRIDVAALTRDPDSSNWGMELHVIDPDKVTKTWALPKELLASTGDSYRASLLRMGVMLEPSKQAKDGLAAYLAAAMPEARALSAKQPGWFNGTFVLPNGVYGQSNERVAFQTTDPDEIKRFSQKGSLESWKDNIASPCRGNSRAVASICMGLAPPLLALLGEDNGGFHFRGNSSIGKSVCLALGSSVWGSNSLIRTWNMTCNGLEGVATMHNDILLPLDEMGQASGKDVGAAAYMLGNGQGKGRANKDGDAKNAKRWRTIVLSSGEKSISDLMAEAGQNVMAGQEVRMVEIDADAGCNFGVFENIHGAKSSQVFAETLKRAVIDHHGHAGRAFVEVLADPTYQYGLVEKVKMLIQRFVDKYVPAGATGQVGRVANRFGLIAAAGEICIELGILSWPEGEAFDGCAVCFNSWINLRGGIGNQEEAKAIAQVRRFIEQHGESRFSPKTETGIESLLDPKTNNRAGFRSVENGKTEYYIFPEVYKNEICRGQNASYVTTVLVEKGFLSVDKKGTPQIEKRFLGMGKIRVYHLKAEFMHDRVSQEEIDETVVRQPEVATKPVKYSV